MLCREGKPLYCGLSLTSGPVPALEPSPSSTPIPPAKPPPHPHTVSGRLSPRLSPGLPFYLCKGPKAGYSVEAVSMGPLHPRDPEWTRPVLCPAPHPPTQDLLQDGNPPPQGSLQSSRGPQPGKAAGEPKRRTWQPCRSARPPPWILLFLKSPQFKERLLPPSRGPPRGLAGGVAHWPACLFSPSASLAARQ